MDKLSTELLHDIISYLDVVEISRYVTISRRIQAVIEPFVFRSVKVKSTELDEFDRILVGQRRNAIQVLKYDVVLPTYSDTACAKFETKKDQDENTQAFSEAIHGIFKVLRSWEDSNSGFPNDPQGPAPATTRLGRPIHFELGVYSPMDASHRHTLQADIQLNVTGQRRDLLARRYEHSFLKLLHPEDLPTISRVASFTSLSYGSIPRRIEGSSVTLIAQRFPNLRYMKWSLNNDERKSLDTGRQVRYEFGESLKSLALPKLQHFDMEMYFITPSNDHFQVPPYLHPSFPSVDHLSLGLCKLSQSPNLTRFKLSEPMIVSSQIFWPSNAAALKEEELPYWPNLEFYEIGLDRVTSFGEWWCELDPDEYDEGEHDHSVASDGSDDEGGDDNDSPDADDSAPDTWDEEREGRLLGDLPNCSFRTVLSREPIESFLLALGRAAARMPRIKRLDVSIAGSGLEVFEVSYEGPEAFKGRDPDDEDVEQFGKGKWELTVGSQGKWKLSDDVRKVWECNGAAIVVEEV
ncbi:hypothetical protein BDN72DRAFT_963517 [Pluteus cervinus]|uniref:Uncharacterized protein n=1 Tax=Pluteus cervinus TaxID=181527 RepID=A0ACD3ADQ3_9AGAR|nr:hypothetical protein BDN72DRAFT_963517 [Pluteus cervinus]